VRRRLTHPLRVTGLALSSVLVIATLAACGSSARGSAARPAAHTSPAPSSAPQASAGSARGRVAPFRAADFPTAHGQTIQRLIGAAAQGPHLALANSVFLPGPRARVAFALIDDSSNFVLAESAVYIAPSLGAPVRGPFPAPLDSIYPDPAYLSRTVARDQGAKTAVYHAAVPIRAPGPQAVLVLSRVGGRLLYSLTGLKAVAHSSIPEVGQRPPLIDTPTLASVHGNVRSIDTRDPPDDMHAVDFKRVVGHEPVAVIFATPLLCQSRLCGPVVDLAEQLKATYGRRMAFIHQEVYAHNMVQAGLRPQLRAFHLQTEPWLFTFDRSGRVAARLEGAFGRDEFRAAVAAALRG